MNNLLYINDVQSFFDYIVERQIIWYRKEVLKLEPPWTDNILMQKYMFCNVYRELDATTQSILRNVNKPSLDKQQKLFACLVARSFNSRDFLDKYIQVCNPYEFDRVAFVEALNDSWDKGLWNPAYIVNTSAGWTKEVNKLDNRKHVQLSYMFESFVSNINENTERLSSAKTGDEALSILQENKFVGPFYAYQVALDVSYMGFFKNGLDEDSILYVGPGALAGLALMTTSNFCEKRDSVDVVQSLWKDHMDYIHESCKKKSEHYNSDIVWEEIAWKSSPTYPRLTLSAIEFSLCEWRKLQYRKKGIGRSRFYK